MALLNFPDPGSIQTYTANGNTWTWNGTSWISANSLNLTSQVTGVLATAYGGTGKTLTGMTVGSVIYADTSSSFAALAPGTSNYVLATQGNGSPPYWKIDDSGTGSVGNGNTGGFAYYTGLNSITSSTGVSYISASNKIVLTSQILSMPSSVIDSGVWAGTAISLTNGGTNGTRSGIGVSYELAVFNSAGTAITQIETTSSIGNSILLQVKQDAYPIWVGQSSLTSGFSAIGVTTGTAYLTGVLTNAAVGSTQIYTGSGITIGNDRITAATFAGNATTATTAGTAGSSTTAGLAVSSTNAGLAVSSTSAGLAVSATNAGLAVSSTSAGLAISATNAGLAVSSTSAGLAVSAGTAGSSTSAGLAISSTNAGLAVSSTSAGLAISATNAGLAVSSTSAGLAISATNAGLAVSSTSAGLAISAGTAGSSTSAGLAISATNAGLAVSSTSAGLAISATNAGLAVSSTSAGLAISSTNAGLAVSSTNAGQAVSSSRSETIRTQTLSGVNYLVLSNADTAATSQSLYVGSGVAVTAMTLSAPLNTRVGMGTNSSTTTSGGLVVDGGVGITGNVNVGGNFVLSGDLTVNGTTITVNSTVSTVVDPIITIGTGVGGTLPNAADPKDRGVAFHYFSSTGKTGFFGWDQSVLKFALYTDASISSEVVNGTKGTLVADLDGNAGTATTATSAGIAGSSTTAGLAVSSTNAGLAVSSTSAGLAVSATNAGLAVSSTSAGLAVSATNAGLAVSSTSAGLAVSAGTAGSSTSAGLAISSTNAGLAVSSTSAGLAISATNAGLAVSSTSAGLAVSAGTAGSSTSAGLAISATNAGLAVSSTSAGLAISATNAGLAVSSTNAGLAVSSTSAGLAISSTNAGLAVSSTNAGLAVTSTNSGLAQRVNLIQSSATGTSYLIFSDLTNGTAALGATTFIRVNASAGSIGASSYTGTWTGTAVTALYGGTGLASVSKLDVLTGAASGNSWIAIGSTFLPSAYIGEFAPPFLAAYGSTQPGQLWWDSTYGVLKVYYADLNTNQWVDALPILGSNGGSAVKRSYHLSFGAGFTPSLGADTVSILVPFAPDNTVSYYYIKRLELRNESLSSGAGVSFYIERNTTRNPSTGWTTANTIFSAAGSSFKAAGIYITSYTNSGSGASFVSSSGVAASIMSGDYLRLNFTALNGAATLSVSLMIEEQ